MVCSTSSHFESGAFGTGVVIPAWCVCVLSSCDQLQSCPWKKGGKGLLFFQPPSSSRLFWNLLHADLGDFKKEKCPRLFWDLLHADLGDFEKEKCPVFNILYSCVT